MFADDVEVLSNGSIDIEMFFSSSVAATMETFDAAVNGILDCDMTAVVIKLVKTLRSSLLATSWVAMTHLTNSYLGCITVTVVMTPHKHIIKCS